MSGLCVSRVSAKNLKKKKKTYLEESHIYFETDVGHSHLPLHPEAKDSLSRQGKTHIVL